ncbi:MAG: hypothetical protein NXH75_17180 [Halobacteriovoraceae bacterium]|nr:hypothetical protein [Halobacteriovoraceae bacterium]
MKNFFIFNIFLFSLASFASNKVDVGTFTVFKGKDDHFYIKKKKEMKGHLPQFEKEEKFQMMQLNVTGAMTKIKGTFTPEEAPHLVFIIYKAGEVGTSKIVREYRCAVYNTNVFKFVGDVPYRSVLLTEKDKENKGTNLKYKFKDGNLEVYERSMLLKKIKTDGL